MGKLKKRYGNKAKRQQWWRDLPQERKDECIEYWKQKKLDDKRDKMITKMKRLKLHYDCSTCIHRVARSCIDYMPDGCTYYAAGKVG